MMGSATRRPISTGCFERASACFGWVINAISASIRRSNTNPAGKRSGSELDRDFGVDPLFVQFVEDILGRRRQNFQPHAREIVPEVGEHARNEDLSHARSHAECQRVLQLAAQPPGGIREAEQVAHHPFGFVQKGAAAVGGLDAARCPAKQLEADLFLEQFDLLADRRLRNIELLCRLGEAALLVDRKGITQLTKIQIKNPYVAGIA